MDYWTRINSPFGSFSGVPPRSGTNDYRILIVVTVASWLPLSVHGLRLC